MKLKLENIGKIQKCELEINGITVVAGENNSGKSTMGKALYSIYHTFYNIEERVMDQRIISINRALRNATQYPLFLERGEIKEVVRTLSGASVNDIRKYFEKYVKEHEGGLDALGKVDFEEMSIRIHDALEIPEESLLQLIFYKTLSAEVGRNIGNVNYPRRQTKIQLTIKGKDVLKISLRGLQFSQFDYINFVKDILYVDDPFVVDELERRSILGTRILREGHRFDLISKLNAVSEPDIIDEYITSKKLEKIFTKLSGICEGGLVNKSGRWLYHSDKLKKDLDLVSISTGMKNFMVLRTLLEKGEITENGIVILDEPEVNLHPEWQLVLAELLVLLHIEFGLNILLNTHSPYFLEAIEAFSKKYVIEDNCKYYLATNTNEWSEIEDVTGETEKIYKLLAAPFQKLEDLLHE